MTDLDRIETLARAAQEADRWSDLEALAEKATPLPWRARLDDRSGDGLWLVETDHGIPDDIALYVEAADAAYIVALVNAAPDLIRDARRGAALVCSWCRGDGNGDHALDCAKRERAALESSDGD